MSRIIVVSSGKGGLAKPPPVLQLLQVSRCEAKPL